jgi:hypothetical protein
MGTDPWRRPASEARREAARRTMTRLNAERRKQDGTEPSASPSHDGTAPLMAEGSEAAPTWATARVDQAPETEHHRAEGGATGKATEQLQDRSIAVGGDVVTALGDAGEGECGGGPIGCRPRGRIWIMGTLGERYCSL